MDKLEQILLLYFEYAQSNKILGIYLIAIAVFVIIFIHLIKTMKNDKFKSSESKNIASKEVKLQSLVFHERTYILGIYSLIALVLLIFPFTGMLLLSFKSVFYSYNLLWQLVPILPGTALALTLLLHYLWGKLGRKDTIVTAFLIALTLFLCSSMGNDKWEDEELQSYSNDLTYDDCIVLFDTLEAEIEHRASEITILAPAHISGYSHMYAGNIRTLYGKDLWDSRARAYNYNYGNYSEEILTLRESVEFMNYYGSFYYFSDTDDIRFGEYPSEELDQMVANGVAFGGLSYFENAKAAGIDVVILHDVGSYIFGNTLDVDALEHIATVLDLNVEEIHINESERFILIYLS